MSLLEDARNIQRKDPAARSVLEVILLYPGFHILVYHRIAHWLYEHGHFFLARWVSQHGRHKTGIEIRIEITSGMWQIIRKYESPDNEYLFPVMFTSATYHQYKSMLSTHNKNLKQVGKLLGIHNNLTSYVMRYTWAAEARRLHVDIAVISQALGHTNEKTTRGYFNRLDQPELDHANQKITNPICRILAGKLKDGSKIRISDPYL